MSMCSADGGRSQRVWKRERCRSGMKWMSVVLAAALAGCVSLAVKDENSSYYPVPVGSKLILHRDLEIPADSARVYLQGGQVVKSAGVFDPYCRFEVRDVLNVPQTLKADEFVVRKTQMDMLHISMHDGVQLAGLSGWGSSESDVTVAWYLWLESPRQPNVRRLICGGKFDAAFRARRPSINEIRIQLGDIASLMTPHEPLP